MATHNVIITTKQAKRIAVFSFESTGFWDQEAKKLALEKLEELDLVFDSWHIGNGDLTVWTGFATKCFNYTGGF